MLSEPLSTTNHGMCTVACVATDTPSLDTPTSRVTAASQNELNVVRRCSASTSTSSRHQHPFDLAAGTKTADLLQMGGADDCLP